MSYIDQVMKNGELVDIHDKRIDNIENLGGGGSSSSTPTSSFDYIQMSASNWNIIMMFDKNHSRADDVAPTINQLITQLNSMGSLSIPTYTDLEDLGGIADYLNALDTTNYAQIKVVFWASMFSFFPYLSLSFKCYVNGAVVPAYAKGVANLNNNSFSYTLKYLDDNGSWASLATEQTVFDFTIHVNSIAN